MKIKSIRIRNFRTIQDETLLEFEDYLTIVGPNNSGKTNILKAIQTFFTGYENKEKYDRKRDFTRSAPKTSKTTINITFLKEHDKLFDSTIFKEYEEIYEYLETELYNPNEFTIYLTFNDNNPNYQLHSNVKKKKDKSGHYSLKQKSIITKVLDHYSIHYIASEKSVKEVFSNLITPLISVELGKKMLENKTLINSVFESTSKTISNHLHDCDLTGFEFKIRPPEDEYSKMIKGFEFLLNDSIETNVFEKGMGIQTASLLACFLWVTEQEINFDKQVIWLLEEPESFLHPSLSETHKKLLHKLRTKSTVINSTHSLQFVPQDPLKVLGSIISSNKTRVNKFKTYSDATKSLRDTLGIEFSHFFNLGLSNVFCEGQTDRVYFLKILELLPQEHDGKRLDFPILKSGETKFLDLGGTSHLEGFLRATFEFIQKERPCVSVFDGDTAGVRAISNLNGYFGNKGIPFTSNKEYIMLRKDFEIEYYFPDEWLKSINIEHPGWFQNFTLDVEENISFIEIKDNSKEKFQNEILKRINESEDSNWIIKWIPVLSTIEKSLESQKEKIKSS